MNDKLETKTKEVLFTPQSEIIQNRRKLREQLIQLTKQSVQVHVPIKNS